MRSAGKFERNAMKKKDFVLILSLILMSFFPLLFFSNLNGNIAKITVDGKLYKTLPLSENKELIITTEYGENIVVIKNKKIFVKSADCKDGVCVKTGEISKSGEIIACLPHKLMIEIEEDE